MDKAYSITLTETNILVNFLKIINLEKVYLNILTVKDMMVIGKMMYKMALELKVGKMDLIMKDSLLKERKVEKVFLFIKENMFGLMDHIMKVIGLRILFLDLGFMYGLRKGRMKVIGLIIVCMGRGLILGLMGNNLLEVIFMIRRMGMVSIRG